MKAEQPWFPRDCDEAVAALKQFRRACVKTTEQSGNAPWLNQPRNDKARAIPVFGSFPGSPADSGVSFHTGSADVLSKKSPSSRALDSLQVVSSTQSLSISSKSNLSLLFSQSEHCRTEPQHGPLSMACAQASATGSHQQIFYSTHPAQDKLQQNNRDNNVQDISGCDKQSAARNRIQTTTSNNPNQNSFVPALSASLPNLPTQTQRTTWLDHSNRTVGSGAFQRRAPQNIELNSPRPHEVSPPRWEPSPSTRTPQPGSSRFGGPRRKPSTMCQTYYKRHPSWCARPTQLCSPLVPSSSSSQFSQKTTPSTTPLSALSSLGTPASSLSSTHSKYKQGPSAHFEMCAPERTWDEMYYHPQRQEYLDAVAVAGLTSPEEIYTPAVPMRVTQQHQMRPLPPPRRPREEVYSTPGLYTPNLEDFESVSESIAAVLAPRPDMSVDHVEYADQNAPLPVRDNLQTARNDIIDEDDHAWNEIMSDFPRSVEKCPPNHNATSRDMYLPSEIHAAVAASAGGSVASDTGVLGQGGVVAAHQDVCTLANRCRLCAGLSYFERLDVHPELRQHRLPNPTLWQSDSENEPQNGMLAHLASESEPVRREYTGSSRGPSVWGAVGEPVPMRLRRYDVQELPGVSGMRT